MRKTNSFRIVLIVASVAPFAPAYAENVKAYCATVHNDDR